MQTELDRLRLDDYLRALTVATEADKKREWKTAMESYRSSLVILGECIPREQNEHFRKGLAQKATEIMNRLSQIEKHVEHKKEVQAQRRKEMAEAKQAELAMQTQMQMQMQMQPDPKTKAKPDPKPEMLVHVEHTSVTWDDIQGLEEAKSVLRDAVELPQTHPNLFSNGLEPWNGVLLFGPPGTGKTMLAKATACSVSMMRKEKNSKTGGNFFSVSASDIMNKFVGVSENRVKTIFMEAHAHAPCVLFIDEIDALLSRRNANDDSDSINRVKSEFLVGMEGLAEEKDVTKRVLMVGATNIPGNIDEAALRRLERRVYVPLPDCDTRRAILRQKVQSNNTLSEQDFEELATATDRMSGSDLRTLCKEAAAGPLKHLREATRWVWGTDPKGKTVTAITRCVSGPECEDDPCVRCGSVLKRFEALEPAMVRARAVDRTDFDRALQTVKPSVSPETIEELEAWMDRTHD